MSTTPVTIPEKLLSPGQVAELFGVDSKTVSRWARQGLISCVRTVGGHRRFFPAELRAHLTTLPRNS
ncbi:helix-turn-helix domain-containing protein [Streptomyces sp. NPDC090021]|uniref:helix-turn-helix domain-containing protein n=1 Tax=Streptomyces sp. NPDC090021 TaxID=3365919 RepID=UPI0038179F10